MMSSSCSVESMRAASMVATPSCEASTRDRISRPQARFVGSAGSVSAALWNGVAEASGSTSASGVSSEPRVKPWTTLVSCGSASSSGSSGVSGSASGSTSSSSGGNRRSCVRFGAGITSATPSSDARNRDSSRANSSDDVLSSNTADMKLSWLAFSSRRRMRYEMATSNSVGCTTGV